MIHNLKNKTVQEMLKVSDRVFKPTSKKKHIFLIYNMLPPEVQF